MPIRYRAGLEPNVGLLDARGTGQIFHNLATQFYAVEFADFCTIAEEIILRDKIILAGKWSHIPWQLRSAIQPFVEAGVFILLNERFDLPKLPLQSAQMINSVQHVIDCNLTASTADDPDFEVRRMLGAELHTGIPTTPLLRQLHHFGLVRRPFLENTVCDLVGQYRRVSRQAKRIRKRYQTFAQLPFISIPPIALTALCRSRDFGEACHEILQLRDEFSNLRNHIRELEERMITPSRTTAEKYEIERQWRERWRTLSCDLGSCNKISLATTAPPLLRNSIKLIGAWATTDIASAIDMAFDAVGATMASQPFRQLRPVHRSVRNYMQMSDLEMKAAATRVFQYDLVKIDRDMELLASGPTSPWTLALNDVQDKSDQELSVDTHS